MSAAATAPPASRPIIESYGPGRFRVSGVAYAGSIIVLPDGTATWPVETAAAVTIESLGEVTAAGSAVELLLLGCGSRTAMVAPALRHALKGRGVALEVMDTGAACRTYNVLAAENRRVAAALIALPDPHA